MMTIDAAKPKTNLEYVETKIAASEVLRATKHVVFFHGTQVSVEVEGAQWEARAWRAVFQGRILPSHVDLHGVRRQLVIAPGVEIEVVEHLKRGEDGRINAAVALIVGFVGLFLWAFAHGSRTPNGAWIAAVTIVGAVVLLLATGIAGYRRRERRDAARTEDVQKRLKQDTSGAHYLDGV